MPFIVPFDPHRHPRAALPPYSAAPVPSAWAHVAHLLERLPLEDQDMIEMHLWGVRQQTIAWLLGMWTQAAVAYRLGRVRLILQHLLCEPPWDRDAVREELAWIDLRAAPAYLEWLTTTRSAQSCGWSHGVRQTRLTVTARTRRPLSRWGRASPGLRALIEWRRAMPSTTPSAGHLRARTTAGEHLWAAEERLVRQRWADEHRPIWLIGP